ncbi:MAG: type III pantothenate kinase [Pirellulaceae bacterium]
MTLLAVNIGNTTAQLAAYESVADAQWPQPTAIVSLRTPELLAEPRGEQLLTEAIAQLAPDGMHACFAASVHRGAEKRLAAWMARHRASDSYHRLTHADLPLRIEVDHPQRVGIDRLVAALAVNRLRDARRPAIVVDAGTVVTVDLVDAEGAFQGGAFLPGLAMTARAMSLDTDALPLVRFPADAPPPPIVGKSTEAAIRSGLFWGTVGAMRETIHRIREQLPVAPQLFITGGDARRMTALLEDDAAFVEDLVPGGIALAAAHHG